MTDRRLDPRQACGLPSHQLAAGFEGRPGTDVANRALFLGQVDETSGHDRPLLQVYPTNERLGANDGARGHVDLQLIQQPEVSPLESALVEYFGKDVEVARSFGHHQRVRQIGVGQVQDFVQQPLESAATEQSRDRVVVGQPIPIRLEGQGDKWVSSNLSFTLALFAFFDSRTGAHRSVGSSARPTEDFFHKKEEQAPHATRRYPPLGGRGTGRVSTPGRTRNPEHFDACGIDCFGPHDKP